MPCETSIGQDLLTVGKAIYYGNENGQMKGWRIGLPERVS